jgi:hypothetical protein
MYTCTIIIASILLLLLLLVFLNPCKDKFNTWSAGTIYTPMRRIICDENGQRWANALYYYNQFGLLPWAYSPYELHGNTASAVKRYITERA